MPQTTASRRLTQARDLRCFHSHVKRRLQPPRHRRHAHAEACARRRVERPRRGWFSIQRVLSTQDSRARCARRARSTARSRTNATPIATWWRYDRCLPHRGSEAIDRIVPATGDFTRVKCITFVTRACRARHVVRRVFIFDRVATCASRAMQTRRAVAIRVKELRLSIW